MTASRKRLVANGFPRSILARSLAFFFLVFASLTVPVSARAQSLTITNSDGRSTTISAAQIASAARVSAPVDERGSPARFEGVPLSAILTMAGVQLGDSLRGPRLAEVLLVTASDGYKVACALAEADPVFATREIILADKRDGKPLDAREGPFRIIAPGDKRPARWIRKVTEMKIVKMQ